MFDQIQDIVEKNVAANAKAWELQKSFVEGVSSRQQAYLNEVLEACYAAGREMAEVKSIGDAFEKQAALGESVKSKLVALTEANSAEVKKLQSALTDVYAVALPAAPAKKKAA